MLEEASEDAEFGINRGGGQAGGLRHSDKIRDGLGSRPRDIIRQHHVAAPYEMTDQHVEGRDHRAEGRVGILADGESGQVTQDAVLILYTEAREYGLILGKDRAIHTTNLHVVTASWP